MDTTLETELVAECAALINASVAADATLADAIKLAAESLTSASLATFNALTQGIKPTDIASATMGTNKDTVARLGIVGQLLNLEGEYSLTEVDSGASAVGAISVAHYVRSLILKLIRKSGDRPAVGLPAIRSAITAAGTQSGAVKALQGMLKATATETESDGEGSDGDGDGDSEVELLDDFARACVAAITWIESAMACKPLSASGDDLARVLAVSDAAAMLSRTFSAIPAESGAFA